ncbi:MAG: hypothetical protein U5K69_18090 [Balneolaceae bacterium]|nr:hypothetical protein [Balneolaceae bacterium]
MAFHSPGEPGIGWDTTLPRIVTWARFQNRNTGQEFYTFNTYFDHRGEQLRLERARLIV